jgi:hypothetical protein
MRVTTNIKRLDLIKFNLRFISSAPGTYKLFIFVVLAIFAYISWSKGLPDSWRDWKILLLGSFSGGIVAVILSSLTCILSILSMSKTSNGILGEHEYEISEHGLSEKTIANESINKWEGIESVKVAGTNILIQISGYLYHVFPLRCFESREEFNLFKEQSQIYLSKAHNKKINKDT